MVDDLFDISARDAGEEGTATIVLRVHAQPGAGRTAVVGRHGDSLKVRVAAPPQGGRANEALTRLLAETFGLRNDQVSLSGGASSRLKRFQLAGVDLDDFRRLLERSLEPGGAGAGPQARLSPH